MADINTTNSNDFGKFNFSYFTNDYCFIPGQMPYHIQQYNLRQCEEEGKYYQFRVNSLIIKNDYSQTDAHRFWYRTTVDKNGKQLLECSFVFVGDHDKNKKWFH